MLRSHNDGDGGAMAIELVVFATIFTLIVLLTGGPGNWR
jgi:hypothetical protein